MSGYLDWQVGDRVVCVDDQWSGWGLQVRNGIACPLICGSMYTISRIGPSAGIYERSSIRLAIHLCEVDHPNGVGFNVARFRKVQPRKTNIAIFTAMLHDNKEHVPG